MYGGLRGSRDRSMLGSRAERGAVGRMERSMGGARYESSSVCHEVETGEMSRGKTLNKILTSNKAVTSD